VGVPRAGGWKGMGDEGWKSMEYEGEERWVFVVCFFSFFSFSLSFPPSLGLFFSDFLLLLRSATLA